MLTFVKINITFFQLRYTFLFKGLEDLHLDEGVQQFISGVNGYLRASDASLCARTYTVIPFGDKV